MAIERDDVPDPGKLLRLARQTMSSAERRKKYRRIDFLDTSFWYPTQLKFFAAGSSGAHQRLIYGGNQTGKTLCCAAEPAWHCTGAYPPWWAGKRFNKPIRALMCRRPCRNGSCAAVMSSAPAQFRSRAFPASRS
jgi:hypothetical protein